MPYTDVADLRGALAPDGTQDETTAASLSDDQLTDVIAEAQAEVDARLRDRYTVPFTDGNVPPLIVQLTRDVAAYQATLIHRRSQPLIDNHPVQLRYKHAQELLVALGKGDLDLEDAAAQTADATVINAYEGSLFTLHGEGIDRLHEPFDHLVWP